MKVIKAETHKVKKNTIGRLSLNRTHFGNRRNTVLVTDKVRATDIGYACVISRSPISKIICASTFYAPNIDDYIFFDGDIVCLTPKGEMHFLWESNELNNALFLTEACNCNCLMCPQPPKKHDPFHIHAAKTILSTIEPGYEGEICITGGEPTLCKDDFLEILSHCRRSHPKARMIVLTNGKSFSNFNFANSVSDLQTNTAFAVSLHADFDILHDNIVGSQGSFKKTQEGLYNLARLNQPVEIRVVVNKLNHDRLVEIAEHIYRNYPFAFHVVFMAQEITGCALTNLNKIWIDPAEYQENLEEALHELHRRGMNVSAYNHPLCLTDRKAWRFARKSISAWKNDYLPTCLSCSVKDECCGIFTTSGDILSSRIRPIP